MPYLLKFNFSTNERSVAFECSIETVKIPKLKAYFILLPKMDDAKTIFIISEAQVNPCLWNPLDVFYECRPRLRNCYAGIAYYLNIEFDTSYLGKFRLIFNKKRNYFLN